jgi:hypothetical protein
VIHGNNFIPWLSSPGVRRDGNALIHIALAGPGSHP